MNNTKKSSKLGSVYYFLAGFDIVAISLSILISHQILKNNREGIAENKKWALRIETYGQLEKLAGDVNAPGNDVFDTKNVKSEEARQKDAITHYNDQIKIVEASFSSVDIEPRKQLVENLKIVNGSMEDMLKNARTIFSYFEKNNPSKAGEYMASMDRAYANLLNDIRKLRGVAQFYGLQTLSDQEKASASFAKLEYLLALMVLIMVSIAVWYGHKLQLKMLQDAETIEAERAHSYQASKLATLGEMAGGIAHEINNPLAIIVGLTQQSIRNLERAPENTKPVIESLAKITATTKRITTIIGGLRSFARDGSKDKFTAVSFNGLINESITFGESKVKHKFVNLEVELASDVEVECRQVQISQVILNLISNSVDAIEKFDDRWIKIKSWSANENGRDYIFLSVTDSGNGISKEIEDKMMQPFFTTKEVGKGTGLGLSISTSIIKDHGGLLYLDRASKNTCFVIKLPKKQFGDEQLRIAQSA